MFLDMTVQLDRLHIFCCSPTIVGAGSKPALYLCMKMLVRVWSLPLANSNKPIPESFSLTINIPPDSGTNQR